MKKLTIFASALAMAFQFTSCDDFLDTVPDNRAEVDSAAKITSILVSAYPQSYPFVLWELGSDNVMDNGSIYDVESQSTEDAYLWRQTSENDTDTPQGVWDNCYIAAAAANQALQAIEQLGGGKSLDPQKGEALICRAYAHFILASTFCVAYDPATADSELGIPYATKPETEVSPHYTRGTLQETYENIAKDIEEGLPLIDDNLYTVPKYHFNKKAAYAFAARFYLNYIQEDRSNYEKVIEYADEVLGSNPRKVLRDYATDMGGLTNASNVGDAFISAKVTANLLLQTVYSSWPYIYGPYSINMRYGQAREICQNEILYASGVWGENTVMSSLVWNPEQKMPFPKLAMYFEYTDKVNGIGYRHAVFPAFSTNETLLCRAEAYVLQETPDYASAVSDINDWIYSVSPKGQNETVSESDIISYYSAIKKTPVPLINAKDRTVRKPLNPILPFVDQNQEYFIDCILQARRNETVHEGLRWLDIRRFGIEVTHNREGQAPDVLTVDDPRRAIQLPADVINAGLEANPR